MAKSIITQNGTIINYSKLLAVYVDEDIDDDENVLGFELVGVTGTEKHSQGIVLGSFADEQSAENANQAMILIFCRLRSRCTLKILKSSLPI